ncbi:MAG: type VI secretion system baseplate subunit TssG, partial [Treponema sp.]|nr:type VI secretion system baseplate subunit TssG [Treponema sp.]
FSFLAKNRWGLESLLRGLFKFPLEIRDYIPSFRDIPPDGRAVLGKKNATLGLDTQIGRTYTSITGKFEIRIGPLSFEEYRSFISGRSGSRLLIEAVALYLDRPLDYSMLFFIQWHTIPLAQLGFDLEEARWDAPRLGYTCWIGNPEDKLTALSIEASRFISKGK